MKGRDKAAHVSSRGDFRWRRSPRGEVGEGKGEMAGLAVVVQLIRWLTRGEDERVFWGTHMQARR